MKTTLKKGTTGRPKTPVVINYATTVSLTVEKVAAYKWCHAAPIHRFIQSESVSWLNNIPVQKWNIYVKCFVLWLHTDSWILEPGADLCANLSSASSVSLLQLNCENSCNTTLYWLQRELQVLSNHEILIFWCTAKLLGKTCRWCLFFSGK